MDEQIFRFQITCPIITGPSVSLIFGNVQTELLFLDTVFVGTAVSPDAIMSTATATGLAVFLNQGTDVKHIRELTNLDVFVGSGIDELNINK